MRKNILKRLSCAALAALLTMGVIPGDGIIRNSYEAKAAEEDCVMVESSEVGKFVSQDYGRKDPFYNTGLRRSEIEKITITTTKKVPDGVIGSLDISEQQNGSVMTWWVDEDNDGCYEAFIGQDGGVKVNKNAHHMFAYIGKSEKCDDTDVIAGIENLDVSNTQNMSSMFESFGYMNLTSFDLGSKFDTSKVIDMSNMFNYLGKIVWKGLV